MMLLTGLLDLANSYCEDELKSKCTELIRRGISVDNAVMFYAAALKFGSSVGVAFRYSLTSVI